MIYLDSSATSFLKPPQVAEAVFRSFNTIGNAGRGAHAPTLNASRLIYDTREKLAALFGTPDPSRIAFTCNATEALNTAIHGAIHPGEHVITTACEHNSVLRPLYLKEKEGTELTIIPADKKGRIRYDLLESSVKSNTSAIVLTHASNLSGNVTDLAFVSNFAKKHGLLLIVDASQTAGSLPINVVKMGIDILCFTGHKGLFGPQGTGGLYVREGLTLSPLKSGGSGIHSFDRQHPTDMPTALEAGTLNGHGIAGLNAGLDYILSTGVKNIHAKEISLARRFVNGISDISDLKLYGDIDAPLRTPIISLNIGNMSSASVSDILWEDYEICVRAGAHCAPLMHKTFGTEKQGAVRFSFSCFNTEAEIDTAIQAMHEIAE
ncbi:aminotransferase class V-fold PLP-dependent enzyme [Coprococcus sp. CLA-AA-H190]|uniref:cysteine desulfurase n=1 Tax=Coprococcus intestinihominis TaxID=3133154 RepID=A0ABV1B1T0_9FIRM|nr:aminotransferase class V-fold PLP-dependent enzyme [Coprococcus catus]MDY5989817.1 aminotransferase class V-fold PLP-dependent enzyme [Coprococcus catus]